MKAVPWRAPSGRLYGLSGHLRSPPAPFRPLERGRLGAGNRDVSGLPVARTGNVRILARSCRLQRAPSPVETCAWCAPYAHRGASRMAYIPYNASGKVPYLHDGDSSPE